MTLIMYYSTCVVLCWQKFFCLDITVLLRHCNLNTMLGNIMSNETEVISLNLSFSFCRGQNFFFFFLHFNIDFNFLTPRERERERERACLNLSFSFGRGQNFYLFFIFYFYISILTLIFWHQERERELVCYSIFMCGRLRD